MRAKCIWEGPVESLSTDQSIKQGPGDIFVLNRTKMPVDVPPVHQLVVPRDLIPDLKGVIGINKDFEVLHWGGQTEKGWEGIYRTNLETGRSLCLPSSESMRMGRASCITPSGKALIISIERVLTVMHEDGSLMLDSAILRERNRGFKIPTISSTDWASEINHVAANDDFFVLALAYDLVVFSYDGKILSYIPNPFLDDESRLDWYTGVWVDHNGSIWASVGGIELVVFSPSGELLRLPPQDEDIVGYDRLDQMSYGIGFDYRGRFWLDWVGVIRVIEFPDVRTETQSK